MSTPTNDKEALLLIINKKIRALADADGALAAALADPASNRAVIQSQIDADVLESNLLDAKFKAIEAGGKFIFPTPAEIQKLINAIAALRTDIARSAAVTTVIQDAATITSAVKSSGI